MSNVMTVDDMLRILTKLSESGKGDMKIKCLDNALHDDELSFDYINNELILRGYLFNIPLADKVQTFCVDIEKAKEKFYHDLFK